VLNRGRGDQQVWLGRRLAGFASVFEHRP
jgi:hypothetical protein